MASAAYKTYGHCIPQNPLKTLYTLHFPFIDHSNSLAQYFINGFTDKLIHILLYNPSKSKYHLFPLISQSTPGLHYIVYIQYEKSIQQYIFNNISFFLLVSQQLQMFHRHRNIINIIRIFLAILSMVHSQYARTGAAVYVYRY